LQLSGAVRHIFVPRALPAFFTVGEASNVIHVYRQATADPAQNTGQALLLPAYVEHEAPGVEANRHLTRPMPALDGPQQQCRTGSRRSWPLKFHQFGNESAHACKCYLVL